MRSSKRVFRLLAATSTIAALSGCATYHTTYTNLHPPGQDPIADGAAELEEAGFFHGWEHFWIFGLLPLEHRVDAADECAYESIEQVRTYQSGLQFLLSNVQGAFIFVNVWSPYSAKIDCARGGNEVASVSRSTAGQDEPDGAAASPFAWSTPMPAMRLASSAWPSSLGDEAACRDACAEEHRQCVAACSAHGNPMECDGRCRRAESDCRRGCGR